MPGVITTWIGTSVKKDITSTRVSFSCIQRTILTKGTWADLSGLTFYHAQFHSRVMFWNNDLFRAGEQLLLHFIHDVLIFLCWVMQHFMNSGSGLKMATKHGINCAPVRKENEGLDKVINDFIASIWEWINLHSVYATVTVVSK